MSAAQQGSLIVHGPTADETRALRRGHKAKFVFQPKEGHEEEIEVAVLNLRYVMDGIYLITFRHNDSTLLMSYNTVACIGTIVVR